jgi:WYL domain
MRHDCYNTTAFKTLYLLQCLAAKPMTREAIQAAFAAHPDIGKAPSEDSIGIYLNTLREIGCEIRRPSKQTQSCYVLTSHPFKPDLKAFTDPGASDFFKQLRAALDGQLTYWDYFYFHRWLASLLSPHAATESLLGDFAHIDWNALEERLRFLEQAIQAQALLKLTYNRAVVQDESDDAALRMRYFLPQRLLARRNTFYVVGYGEDYDVSQMLRLDRIQTVQRDVLHPDIRDTLRKKHHVPQPILVQCLNTTPSQYSPMPLAYDGNGQAEIVTVDPHSPQHCLVLFKTDNQFMVTRHLLSSGRCFRILFPHALRTELQQELSDIQRHYAIEETQTIETVS